MKFEEIKVYILIFRMHQNDTEEVKFIIRRILIYSSICIHFIIFDPQFLIIWEINYLEPQFPHLKNRKNNSTLRIAGKITNICVKYDMIK